LKSNCLRNSARTAQESNGIPKRVLFSDPSQRRTSLQMPFDNSIIQSHSAGAGYCQQKRFLPGNFKAPEGNYRSASTSMR
jgi:hypothetical protein